MPTCWKQRNSQAGPNYEILLNKISS